MKSDRSKPTISQVAAAAGVNRSSVSRAFSRPEMLNPETVERILAAAAEIGYVPNHVARALSTGKHGNIALIVPDVANPFFPPLIRAAQAQAETGDLCVFLGSSDEQARQEDKLLARFSSQVEGVILVSSRLSADRITEFAARIPLVLINREVPGIARVLIDSGSGVADAVDHLAGLGHRRIAYVSGPGSSWSNRQRLNAVRRTAKRTGAGMAMISAKKPTFEAGREATAAVLASGATAAICFDDLMAQGLMAGVAEAGRRVPDDLSVVGCDDVLGAATYPALTTVSSRTVEAGRTAAWLLMDMMQSNSIQDARHLLETSLVVRNSTAPPPRA
ncbi:substrate-binding domain-containing protein [Rhodobacterales bacterium HKCCE2091]|nr:substrate-binding domain-containing protein [Rhodobacterales bacterium HKCCE2091]